MKTITFYLFLISITIFTSSINIQADIGLSENPSGSSFQSKLINIRNTSGKLYAYIVLLFNENPHFVNLIQEDSIPLKLLQKEGFHVIEYKRYLNSINNPQLKNLASTMLSVYLNPKKFNEKKLLQLEETLRKYNVILRFSSDTNTVNNRIILDYCIFGKRKEVNITHPLFNFKERIYNIQPLIYYDEFSTSNSTFYFDMIYINPEEVHNDYIIAKNIIKNKSVDSMFFVGARVTDDIKYCLRYAFKKYSSIKKEIWNMFVIHEITHKILNNRFNFFDQVLGEELALVSTIYSNPYLGLAVLYSYLDYNAINPHRIAAMNFIRFIANRKGKLDMIDDPSWLKELPSLEISKLAKEHFDSIIKSFK